MQRGTHPGRFMPWGFATTSEVEIPASPGLRRVSVFTCTKAPSQIPRPISHPKPTTRIPGARVKVSRFVHIARHMSRFGLTVNFRSARKLVHSWYMFYYPSLVIARSVGGTSADVRTELSPVRGASSFSPSPTQSGYATEFNGCATPEKQIPALLQSCWMFQLYIR